MAISYDNNGYQMPYKYVTFCHLYKKRVYDKNDYDISQCKTKAIRDQSIELHVTCALLYISQNFIKCYKCASVTSFTFMSVDIRSQLHKITFTLKYDLQLGATTL